MNSSAKSTVPTTPQISWRHRLFAAYYRTPAHPSKLRIQSWLRRFLTIHSLRVEVSPGVIMELDESDFVQHELLYGGGYERETVQLFDRLLAGARGFLDVGAHHGLYTLRAAKALALRGTRVFAFEPMPANSQALIRNARLNRLTNIDVCTVALSNRSEITRMVLPFATNTGGARLETGHHAPGNDLAILVAVHPIADVLPAIPPEAFDLVKIDVEGFELRILESLFSSSAPRPKHLILEYAPRAFDYGGSVPSWLERHGYHVRTVRGDPVGPDMMLPEDNLWAELRL